MATQVQRVQVRGRAHLVLQVGQRQLHAASARVAGAP
jgi:hypothetical protein